MLRPLGMCAKLRAPVQMISESFDADAHDEDADVDEGV